MVFTIRDDALQIPLRRRAETDLDAGGWALPGRCVAAGEALDDCAQRALSDQTGLADVYLEQLYTFGRRQCQSGAPVIAVAYYALVSGDRQAEAEQCGAWWPAGRLPELHAGHEGIVRAARERLEAKLEYSTIAFQLMPEYFTLSELQGVYETICERPVDKRNFRKRVLALADVEATERKRRNGSHRPARLYRYTARGTIQFLK